MRKCLEAYLVNGASPTVGDAARGTSGDAEAMYEVPDNSWTRRPPGVSSTVDVLVGASALTVSAAASVVRHGRSMVVAVADMALDAPMLPRPLRPRRYLALLAARGVKERDRARRDVIGIVDATVPIVIEQLLRGLDATRALADHVEIDGVTARVELDASARRLNVTAMVHGLEADSPITHLVLESVTARVELDQAAHRLDVDATVMGLRAHRAGAD
jgi:hypothetical protein